MSNTMFGETVSEFDDCVVIDHGEFRRYEFGFGFYVRELLQNYRSNH